MRVLLTNNITCGLCFRAFQFNEVMPLLLGSELFIRRKGFVLEGQPRCNRPQRELHRQSYPCLLYITKRPCPHFIQYNQHEAASHAPPPPSSLILCIPQFIPMFNTFLCKPPRPLSFTFSFTLHLFHPRQPLCSDPSAFSFSLPLSRLPSYLSVKLNQILTERVLKTQLHSAKFKNVKKQQHCSVCLEKICIKVEFFSYPGQIFLLALGKENMISRLAVLK